MPNAAAGTIAMRLGAQGPGFSIASACATGAHAIGEAARMIARGEADVIVAGGAEATLNGLTIAAFKSLGALSQAGHLAAVRRPPRRVRHGRGRGRVRARVRGARAGARRAKSSARVAGYGASNDAFHITEPDREGRGATDGDARARLRDAGRDPADVGYVNAHGTSTPYNDRVETMALHSVFNGGAPPVSSTKSAIGHLLGAAGAVEAVACLGRDAARRAAADDQLRGARPRVRPRLRARRAARGAGPEARAVATRSASAARTPAWRSGRHERR